jgi:wyosine [tRNA(Phe)-imidazoG37] synthetase (radical SAM superfamily)
LETRHFHNLGTPCLISSLVLRSHGLGQIDVAYLKKQHSKWQLHIIEVKTKTIPGKSQWRRLLKAQNYLSKVLEVESNLKVKFCKNEQDSLFF